VAVLLFITPAVFAQDAAPEAINGAEPGLQPGEHVTYRQQAPVNLVFVGYEQGDFNLRDLKNTLPGSYTPVVRYPRFYGLTGRDLGLRFNFKYNTVFASQKFEDDFFGYLSSIAMPGPMTPGMEYYNNQVTNILDVTNPVWYIDAPSTEQWLMNNAHRLRVDTSKGYTIFYINWYNRRDFNFHLYTKTDFLDPDLNYNHGANDWYRVTTAWGGSHGRRWFYDLSAGPEDWSFTENVDNPDLDGDGIEEYRMPPIWEYDPDGYRDPAALGGDLGLVTRYIAINLLFTSSPLYDPLVSSPDPSGQKVVHNEIFELDGQPAVDGTDFYKVDYTISRLAGLQPYYNWYGAVDLNDPADAATEEAILIFSGNALLGGCWEDYGTPFAQLFCHFNANYDLYVPAYEPPDYVAPVFSFNLTDELLGDQFGLLGFADDNWVDGTPSYLFIFNTPTYRDLGFGFSAVTVHEVGHHIGLSHPHDGYDSEQAIDYGPGGPFFFAWQGDYSATTMSYMWNNDGFGVFDQDNMNRYQFAGYLNWANAVLADIVAHPDAASVQAYVDAAEAEAVAAQRAFNRWDYAAAAAHARASYEQIALAAMALGIDTTQDVYSQMIAPTGAPPKEGDRLKGPSIE
jgi:hypothetical protein